MNTHKNRYLVFLDRAEDGWDATLYERGQDERIASGSGKTPSQAVRAAFRKIGQ